MVIVSTDNYSFIRKGPLPFQNTNHIAQGDLVRTTLDSAGNFGLTS